MTNFWSLFYVLVFPTVYELSVSENPSTENPSTAEFQLSSASVYKKKETTFSENEKSFVNPSAEKPPAENEYVDIIIHNTNAQDEPEKA